MRMLLLMLATPTVGALAIPPVSKHSMSPFMQMRAVLMPCPLEEAMLPGESRWLYLYDETRAALMSTGRSSPYAGLIAQDLSALSAEGEIVPLLRLQKTRKKDRAGAYAEVVCVGRGVISSCEEQPLLWDEDPKLGMNIAQPPTQHELGFFRTASVAVYGDDSEDCELCDAAVHELKLIHSRMRNATARAKPVDGKAAQLGWSDEGGTGDLADLLGRSLEELVSEQRISLQRQGLVDTQDCGSAELLSYAASRCLGAAGRKRALASRSTRERLELCTEALRERHSRVVATSALQQALRLPSE